MEQVKILFRVTRFYTDKILSFIAFLLSKNNKPTIPPINDDLLFHKTADIKDNVVTKKEKVPDYVEAYVERMKILNPFINALVKTCDDSEKVAADLDKQIEAGSLKPDEKPLLGVPFVFDSSIPVKGMPLTSGLVSRRDKKAKEDCEVVKNLRNAGAIPLALTNTSEFLVSDGCCNKINGETRNPFDLTRTAGGSSGGSAALISTTGALVGIGADTAGSIRMPAAFCGIFSHKPSHGLIPLDKEIEEQNSLYTIGPLCRYVEDIIPMLTAMGGEKAKAAFSETPNLNKLVVYYRLGDKDALKSTLVPECANALMKAVKFYEGKGIRCVEVTHEGFDYTFDFWIHKYRNGKHKSILEAMGGKPGLIPLMIEITKGLLGQSQYTMQSLTLAFEFEMAQWRLHRHGDRLNKQIANFQKWFDDLLRDNGIFLYPSHPTLAPKQISTLVRHRDVGYSGMFNVLGLPVTQCPIELADGVPVGIQIAAKSGNDKLTIEVAKDLSEKFGGWIRPE